MAQFTLYDLPSRDPCKCWSLNPWKTRLLLNYKNLPYETQWVEYPDIKPTFEKHIAPNKEGFAYTIPTVKFPDGSIMQDSREIAIRIEKEHSTPTVHLNSEVLAQLEKIMPQLMPVLSPIYIPNVPRRLLNEASLPHWYKTREERFGMPLDQLEKEKGGDQCYEKATPYLQEITELLKSRDNGPFFEGNQVTYADFIWAGFLRFMQRIGDDVYEKILKATGDPELHKAHISACDPWLARDDH